MPIFGEKTEKFSLKHLSIVSNLLKLKEILRKQTTNQLRALQKKHKKKAKRHLRTAEVG